MEHLGAIFEGEWSSMNGIGHGESDFMAQLLGNCTFSNDTNFPAFYATNDDDDQSAMYMSDETNIDSMCYSFLQGGSGRDSEGDTGLFPFLLPSTQDSYCFPGGGRGSDFSHDQFLMNDTRMMEETKEDNNTISHEYSNAELVGPTTEVPSEISPSERKKRSRIPDNVQRSNKRSANKLKKCTSIDENDEDNSNTNVAGIAQRQMSSSSCCSEDDSNASCSGGSKGSGALNSNGKTRAGRGSATDPQSLYARKRREKINERLRILQKLVPNGTKVDISTMLEEAVDYVKFLQLQIKLLSSDDMWMYAPIAYNGMELELESRISKHACS